MVLISECPSVSKNKDKCLTTNPGQPFLKIRIHLYLFLMDILCHENDGQAAAKKRKLCVELVANQFPSKLCLKTLKLCVCNADRLGKVAKCRSKGIEKNQRLELSPGLERRGCCSQKASLLTLKNILSTDHITSLLFKAQQFLLYIQFYRAFSVQPRQKGRQAASRV